MDLKYMQTDNARISKSAIINKNTPFQQKTKKLQLNQ